MNNMRIVKGLLLCVALMPWAGPSSNAGNATTADKNPVLACKNPVCDFGTLDNAKPFEHTFVLWNEGNAPLEISRVRFCCGVSGALAQKVVAPGTNTTLSVKFSLIGRVGKQLKNIYVHSNDPAHPYYQLTLAGVAQRVYGAQSGTINVNLGKMLEGQTIEKEIPVSCPSSVVFRITNIVCDVDRFVVTRKATPAANTHLIKIRAIPPLAIGTTEAGIQLFTDHPVYGRIDILATVSVVSDFVVVPSEVRIVLFGEKQPPVTQHLTIRSRSGKAFKIMNAEVPNSDIKIEYVPLDGHGYGLKLNNIVPGTNLTGKAVVIGTDHETEKEILVPFDIRVPLRP